MTRNRMIAEQMKRLRAGYGEPLEYRRGEEFALPCSGIVGQTTQQTVTEAGIVSAGQLRDFLIGVEELAFEGDLVIPQAGDRICRLDVEGLPVFEVLPDGDDVYRFSDPLETQYRIHTKGIGADE